MFQSTHPRGVRHFVMLSSKELNRFNPRTHVGCDHQQQASPQDDSQFQSTHPRGVRLQQYAVNAANARFNPRTHVGCD